jgi:hypothetical protein
LIVQPIRNSAAGTCFALTEGHFRDGCSGRHEGDAHRSRYGLTMLQAVRQQPQRQGFDGGRGALLGPAIRRDAGKGGDVGKPAAVVLAAVLDGERKTP